MRAVIDTVFASRTGQLRFTGYVIMLFMSVIIFPGCFQHYFKTQTQTNADDAAIKKLMSLNKYFILHGQNRITGLENVTVSNNVLQARIVPLPAEHSRYTDIHAHSRNVVSRKDMTNTLSEVHLYMAAKIDSSTAQISLPLSSVNQFDVYEFDAKATKTNHIMSWVGITLGAAAMALVIVVGSAGFYY